ncbi:phage holin family protein [Thermomonospora cellulosilytica]|uniref:Putative membrane protein n=1 Tax=Thermomonospora cellulosilytica TaxID=1411118 RepID=A0A7W3N3S4_9ACTN|nr:phage holin family protein [Thermomonospora cellulosilytica]MBA9006987.1 putative membrane protein [Thermomonospora cellulosilytica]
MYVLIRVLSTAVALWVATALVDGVDVETGTGLEKAATLLAVAVIVGLVNVLIKPVVKVLGCAFYVLTLGLFALVVNAALLVLAGWIAGELDLPFHVEWFWPAFWGALIVGVVSWLLTWLLEGVD